MRKELAIMCAAVCLARTAFAITMASQTWTTNRIAEAEARIADKITAATNAIPAPDYSTGNAQLVETIEATAPAPGDYSTVSNRAMSAIQQHQSLEPATNYTDAALLRFAEAFTVERVPSVGNDTYWQDATGCVWRVARRGAWTVTHTPALEDGDTWGGPEYITDPTSLEDYFTGAGWYICGSVLTYERIGGDELEEFTYTWYGNRAYTTVGVRAMTTNLVGRVALTGTVTNIAEAVVREKSLGGIWDEALQVWWTPVMRNGALTYQATTNVNLNAEN